MGSSTLLDIIGSFAIGGILLLMGLRLNASANETTAVYFGNYILQANITTAVDILENDFRKIGYCRDWRKIPDPTKSIRIADSTRIRFWADYDNDGTLDSITYYIGPTSDLSTTPNPRDRFLYRQINNQPAQAINLGVTQFTFRYFDAENDPIAFPVTDPTKVYFMQLSLKIESAVPYQQEYANDPSQYEVYWKQLRLVTKNFKNR